MQSRATHKVWVAVFTCFQSRSVHAEVIHKMDMNAMMNAISRFSARRPGTTNFYSDNGTNLKGADAEMKREMERIRKEMDNGLMEKGIEWTFIPPHAAHYGGTWERIVGLFKRHIKALETGEALNIDVFTTVITEIEAILNRRPLTAISTDSRDCEALTPAHILYPATFAHSSTSLTAYSSPTAAEALRSAWKKAQARVNSFWKKWSQEYVVMLHDRKKWEKTSKDLSVGDLVLIVDDQLARHAWKLGRIVDIEGDATHIRKAMVKRADGKLLHRDRTKLVHLELDG